MEVILVAYESFEIPAFTRERVPTTSIIDSFWLIH